MNPKAEISVKLVSESGVGTIAAGVAKAKADRIIISGAEGGTGASPASSIRYAGMSPEIGLSETQQTLVLNGLRARMILRSRHLSMAQCVFPIPDGACFSNYFTGRDANQGACTHPCRWKYSIVEETRPNEYMPVYENERGTYIF